MHVCVCEGCVCELPGLPGNLERMQNSSDVVMGTKIPPGSAVKAPSPVADITRGNRLAPTTKQVYLSPP